MVADLCLFALQPAGHFILPWLTGVQHDLRMHKYKSLPTCSLVLAIGYLTYLDFLAFFWGPGVVGLKRQESNVGQSVMLKRDKSNPGLPNSIQRGYATYCYWQLTVISMNYTSQWFMDYHMNSLRVVVWINILTWHCNKLTVIDLPIHHSWEFN